jgi:predicted transcriptional regulator
MNPRKRLTEAEWEIMEGVWALENGQGSAREVHNRLYPDGRKAYPTVQTILNILTEKGFLRKEMIGQVNFYTPAVSRQDVGQQETHSLVSRVYGGSFGALASYLVDSGALSPEEMKRLKNLIQDKESE